MIFVKPKTAKIKAKTYFYRESGELRAGRGESSNGSLRAG